MHTTSSKIGVLIACECLRYRIAKVIFNAAFVQRLGRRWSRAQQTAPVPNHDQFVRYSFGRDANEFFNFRRN